MQPDYTGVATEYLELPAGLEISKAKNSFQIQISRLGQGEYNINFLIVGPGRKYLLRLNTGSQQGLSNQTRYEYETLKLARPPDYPPNPSTAMLTMKFLL